MQIDIFTIHRKYPNQEQIFADRTYKPGGQPTAPNRSSDKQFARSYKNKNCQAGKAAGATEI